MKKRFKLGERKVYMIFNCCKQGFGMENRKKGLRSKSGVKMNFFKTKLVLDSFKNKVAFGFIVLMFGVVIVLAGMDAFNYRINLVNGFEENVNGAVGGANNV